VTTPTTVKVQLKLRQDTSSGWSAVNPILLAGELGRESNTGKIKIGDGSTAWNSLAYQPFGALITNADISATAEIAVSKLADGAARQLLQTDTAGTGVEWTSNVDVPGTLDVTGAATFDAAVTIDGNSTAASFIPTGSTVPTNGVYLSAANNVSIATNSTERLRIDAAGQIEAVSLGSAAAPTFSWTGDPNTGIYSPGADQVAISTNGTGRLFVDDAGRVGINGTPSTVLDVFSTSEFQLGLQARTSSTQTAVGNHPIAGLINTSSASGNGVALRFSIADTSGASRAAAQIGAIATAKTASSVTADIYFAPSAVERMRLDSSGRLGLGTSSPKNLLHVNGTVNLGNPTQNQTSNNIILVDAQSDPADTNKAAINLGTTAGASSSDSFISFFTNKYGVSRAERVRIDPEGRVGIGTTSPRGLLSVSNNSTGGSFDSSIQIGYSVADYYGFRITNSNNPSSEYAGALKFERGTGATWSEAMRLDNSGRLLVGTSSGVSAAFVNSSIQAHGITGDASSVTLYRFTTSATAAATPRLVMARSGSDSKDFTVVANGNRLGQFNFVGADGTQFISAASIDCEVDGTPGTNDMPGRLVLSVTLDGASSPTEALRITNDRVVAYNQPAPAAVNATATLTVANLKTGIITSTSAAATDMTLPTGTDTQAGFSGTYDNFTFEWSVINTGPSLVRVLAGTAHTIVGSGSVATGTSGRFASRRTAANTFVTYRLS
jgi:hypothetical protein